MINNEEAYENSIIDLFKKMGYTYRYGPDISDRDYRNPLLMDELESNIYRINAGKNRDAIGNAIQKIMDMDIGSLEAKNDFFTDCLQNGVEVTYFEDDAERSTIIYLVDYDDVDNNQFTFVNQWTIIGTANKRPDGVMFLNGLPLVVMEFKSPSREEVDISDAYLQLRNYMKIIPSIFYYNVFCIISDQVDTKVGTITSDETRYVEWKSTDGSYENTQYADYYTLFEGMFEKNRFLDIIRNFTLYFKDSQDYSKILAGYHQYFAVRKAVESTLSAIGTSGKGGVFWHTQGSGKSLSMIFYVHLLRNILDSPTFVVITDRNDLDHQLYTQFINSRDFLGHDIIEAESREDLKDLIDNRVANGIIFTTMQKFEEYDEPLTNREDVIVISDEAHRSQYGLEERVDSKTGRIKKGAARLIRDSLPHATYIGFTGTPISRKDKNTREVFGDYIDVYDMTQSVEDGATVPIFYESRAVNIGLDEDVLKKIDDEYELMREYASDNNIERSKKELSRMESLLGDPDTINSLCMDIINHYENNREMECTGKAMIVAYSRKIAMEIYYQMLKLRPNWTEKVKVVMTQSNKDPEEWHEITGDKRYRQKLAIKFKDDNDPMKIAIVVDMWLTGFDVPSLTTMYIFKPMKEHNLMQAIARVNRVFQGKQGGLIVDYIGLSSALRNAMNEYTDRDQKNYGDMNVEKIAYPKFQEELDICQDLMYGYDYSKFFGEDNFERSKTISGGANYLEDTSREETKKQFLKEALLLKQSLSLCRSVTTEEERYEAAYFEAVRSLINKITEKGQLSFKDINKRITDLLKQSIKSSGVINLFSDTRGEISLFDPDFLDRISRLKDNKNVVVKVLEKLLKDQVRVYKHSNLVKSEEFSERMKKVMNDYINRHITNEQVIKELLKMAKDIKNAHEEGNELNLTVEELGFYNALTKPEAIKDVYTNDELVAMTHELTESLNRNKTVDWQKKKKARAKMRMTVKKLLKKYKYPPDEMKDALDIVLKQCELWTDNTEMET